MGNVPHVQLAYKASKNMKEPQKSLQEQWLEGPCTVRGQRRIPWGALAREVKKVYWQWALW